MLSAYLELLEKDISPGNDFAKPPYSSIAKRCNSAKIMVSPSQHPDLLITDLNRNIQGPSLSYNELLYVQDLHLSISCFLLNLFITCLLFRNIIAVLFGSTAKAP